jgi:hypothetical protein
MNQLTAKNGGYSAQPMIGEKLDGYGTIQLDLYAVVQPW